MLGIKRSWAELDSNVRLLYIFTLTYYATVGILKEHLLSGFVYVLTQSNKSVGILKGITGLFQAAFFTWLVGYEVCISKQARSYFCVHMPDAVQGELSYEAETGCYWPHRSCVPERRAYSATS